MGATVKVEVAIQDKANNNQPIAVDYVLIYDEKLLDEILRLPAKVWFEKRGQYKRDHPLNAAFDSWEWEWIPGQQVISRTIPLMAKAKGGVIFANYHTKGDHRARVDPHQNIRLTLLEDSFVVEPR
jgi:type VI secretion system protein